MFSVRNYHFKNGKRKKKSEKKKRSSIFFWRGAFHRRRSNRRKFKGSETKGGRRRQIAVGSSLKIGKGRCGRIRGSEFRGKGVRKSSSQQTSIQTCFRNEKQNSKSLRSKGKKEGACHAAQNEPLRGIEENEGEKKKERGNKEKASTTIS